MTEAPAGGFCPGAQAAVCVYQAATRLCFGLSFRWPQRGGHAAESKQGGLRRYLDSLPKSGGCTARW